MARPPLIIDTPMGRLYCIDLGGAAVMLMIEQDGQAQSFPLDNRQAWNLGQYLRPLGKPAGAPNLTREHLQQVVDLYVSAEAGDYGSRTLYVADQLGLSKGQANSRIAMARQRGMLTQKFSTTGKPIDG